MTLELNCPYYTICMKKNIKYARTTEECMLYKKTFKEITYEELMLELDNGD